ncbi:IS3 family transposase [Gulosibacter molinativorax]|uniref:IS3 family transposase n=1 Tax=Gulosibacter molinativorax TaxID=256821 RepID=A0ABT7CD08_9MICO|nr:IS3 family transposase [Gulosibacter molinativorax]MDJ1372599.1 IS3 family transposase [Gulosibacter molinativorax]QUY62262.1 Transposase for insertion sequence element IS629 [Gulosibacter molinativorax]
MIVRFIDEHRQEYGVEPIVRALQTTPARIAASSYYAFKKRPESARKHRDARLKVILRRIWEENYSCYGARKLWHAINREPGVEPVARCTVERLMREMGIRGVQRRRKRPATKSADPEACPTDLVEREFTATEPNTLWVADITYIQTSAGWVYAAFVLDVCTREIVGWQVTNHLRASLAADALHMALAARLCAGESVTGLTHHSDRGVHYRAIRYAETLAENDVVASVGSKGDSYR